MANETDNVVAKANTQPAERTLRSDEFMSIHSILILRSDSRPPQTELSTNRAEYASTSEARVDNPTVTDGATTKRQMSPKPVLKRGNTRANVIADKTLNEVREAMGTMY